MTDETEMNSLETEETSLAENHDDPASVIQNIVRNVLTEVLQSHRSLDTDARLQEEISRREELEAKLNEVIAENRENRQIREEKELEVTTRSTLHRLGVVKTDLAFHAIKNLIYRKENGVIVARTDAGEMQLNSFLQQFLDENPELVPARLQGGSGIHYGQRNQKSEMRIDLDKIGPGMSAEELERARKEIVRVASETFRGL